MPNQDIPSSNIVPRCITTSLPFQAAPSGRAVRARDTLRARHFLLPILLSTILGAGMIYLGTDSKTLADPQRTAIARESSPMAQTLAADRAEIAELLENWRRARQTHDLSAYLNNYSNTYRPIDGRPRDHWLAKVTTRFAAKEPLHLWLRDIITERIHSNLFKVRFQQESVSGRLRTQGRSKTLYVAREGEGWKIVGESED